MISLGVSSANGEVVDYSDDLFKLHNIVLETSDMYSQIGPGANTYQEMLTSSMGNCREQAYVFARKVLQEGYIPKVIGLFSVDDANHLLVDVKVGDSWYLFDPANGVYYKHSVYEILKNPALSGDIVGTPKEISKFYTMQAFFKGVQKINVYNNLDYIEKDIASLKMGTRVIERSEFYNYPYGVEASLDGETKSNYTAALENSLPNYFEIDFGSVKEFYRVVIEWYSYNDYASDFEIFYEQSGTFVSLVHEVNYVEDDKIYQYVLKEPIKTQRVRVVVNNTNGQKRLLMRRFSLMNL